jgi:SAM-dependent methyltransferase
MLDHATRDRAELAIDCYLSAREDTLPEDANAKIGDGDYAAIGAEFLRLMVDLGGLEPDSSVLDIGCGLGRLAQPLKYYLGPDASYFGFDVVRENVEWCLQNIRDERERFGFFHVDVRHPLYNPGGRIGAEDITLPIAGETLDFVLMVSVFTHLSAAVTERYLSEVSRILLPGGRLFATFFVIDERTRPLAGVNHRYPFDLGAPGPVYTPPQDTGFAAAAIEEDWLLDCALRRSGFTLVNRAEGHWPYADPEPGTPFQDILVFEK